MSKGGYRVGSGRPPGSKDSYPRGKPRPRAADAAANASDGTNDAREPLDYLLAVMADPNVDPVRRDRCAIALLPFRHQRIGDQPVGKKERELEAAHAAATGKFKTPDPPRAYQREPEIPRHLRPPSPPPGMASEGWPALFRSDEDDTC